MEEFIKKFPYFARDFKDDIFNADECTLFQSLGRSLIMIADKFKSRKLTKERFTVMLCASSTREKLKSLMNGKDRRIQELEA